MKKILNFNHKSLAAWLTLGGAGLSAGIAILKLFGIEITPDQTKDVTLAYTAILNVLVAAGILTAPTDKKEDNQNGK
ncbi:hypothetical protein LFYK43_11150 [Ligilactobacillus salitolerans]|uniref:Holin n=1 Tax=Ligilactobacillus salitolerans TaxID=1808352 RepID=A0A401IT04_9LACO|nr:hypothetical protein [Ligilactobacillus salitolerans]GBG94656.1 hypothetical protein LFYK43_11150 [Ligilactobacillus salitolerans]